MDGEPSRSLLGALSQAHRRARRVGMPVVGTDLVFFYALVRVPGLWRLLPSQFDRLSQSVRRGTARLVDPDPPTRLYPTFDDLEFEAAGALRQAVFHAADNPRPVHRRARRTRSAPVFSPGVQWAVHEALHEARLFGVSHARPEHLVSGLLALPGAAASQLLGRDRARRLTSVVRARPEYRANGDVSRWAVDALTMLRALPPDRDPVMWRWAWQLALKLLVFVLVSRHYRRHGARYGHPLLFMVELYAPDKAAYTGHDHVTAAHVLLTVLHLHEQLTSAGKRLPTFLARWNTAGGILARHGITRQAATRAAARLARDPVDDEDNYDELPRLGWPTIRKRPGAPTPGRTALLALRQASLSARRLGHPYAGTTHLLAALLTDPTGPAARLLRELGIDPDTVRSEAEAALGPPLDEPVA